MGFGKGDGKNKSIGMTIGVLIVLSLLFHWAVIYFALSPLNNGDNKENRKDNKLIVKRTDKDKDKHIELAMDLLSKNNAKSEKSERKKSEKKKKEDRGGKIDHRSILPKKAKTKTKIKTRKVKPSGLKRTGRNVRKRIARKRPGSDTRESKSSRRRQGHVQGVKTFQRSMGRGREKSPARGRDITPRLLPGRSVLAAIGRRMRGRRMGGFPAIEFDYDDPREFIRQMYGLGCKSMALNNFSDGRALVDLLDNRIMRVTSLDLSGFSHVKRVIEDRAWRFQRRRVARQMDWLVSGDEDVEFILLVPLDVEDTWYGYIVDSLRKQGIDLSRVSTVVLRVNADGGMVLTSIGMRDGSRRPVSGWPAM